MIRFNKEGLTTDDPQVAAMFLDAQIDGAYTLTGMYAGGDFDVYDNVSEKILTIGDILIEYPTVLSAIQPVEGEGYILDFPTENESARFVVWAHYRHMDGKRSTFFYYHKRVLNIVTTRGELREFIERCQEAKVEDR